MRTQRISKYLMAMIIALGTSFNVFAQERALKIYFQEYETDATGLPPFIAVGDVPITGFQIIPTPEGIEWAQGYRWFEGWHGSASDRLIASYVDTKTKMDSRLKISFANFPYEVNAIQWNAMNDLLSGSIFDLTDWDSNLFDNYTVNYTYSPQKGSAITGSEQQWDMNPFNKNLTFSHGDMPGASGLALKGLNYFEIQEENYFRYWFFGWHSRKTALDDRCRTFLKAGWDGESWPEDIDTDADKPLWAFSIKYTMPELSRKINGLFGERVYMLKQTLAVLLVLLIVFVRFSQIYIGLPYFDNHGH